MGAKKTDPSDPHLVIAEAIDAAMEMGRRLQQYLPLLVGLADQGFEAAVSEALVGLAKDIITARAALRGEPIRELEIKTIYLMVKDAHDHEQRGRQWPITFGILDGDDRGGGTEDRFLRALAVKHPRCVAALRGDRSDEQLRTQVRQLIESFERRGKRRPVNQRAAGEEFWPRMSRFVGKATVKLSPARLRVVTKGLDRNAGHPHR